MHTVLNSVGVYEPEISGKTELHEKIHFTTMKLWYKHISLRVVEGFPLTRILDQLMRQCANSNG
jgi:hypothetical protein